MSQVIFYINVYKSGESYSISSPYEQESKAIEAGKTVIGYIKTVVVDFEYAKA